MTVKVGVDSVAKLPRMDPPRHLILADDIAKLPRIFENGSSTPYNLLLAIGTLRAGLWGCAVSTATPRVKVGKLSLILLDGP